MYYLKMKAGCDPYELDDYIEFNFENLEELFEFAHHILNVSYHEVIIGNCYPENEDEDEK